MTGDHVALGDAVPDLDLDLPDGAALSRGHLHGRLVGFQRDQRVVDLDRRSRLHMDLDDRHVLVVADIRDPDLDRLIHAAGTAVTGLTWAGGRSGVLLDPLLGRNGGRPLRLQSEDEVAL